MVHSFSPRMNYVQRKSSWEVWSQTNKRNKRQKTLKKWRIFRNRSNNMPRHEAWSTQEGRVCWSKKNMKTLRIFINHRHWAPTIETTGHASALKGSERQTYHQPRYYGKKTRAEACMGSWEWRGEWGAHSMEKPMKSARELQRSFSGEFTQEQGSRGADAL